MSVDATTRALLDVVEADRARQCAALLDAARAEAAETIAQAHADARATVQRTFADVRERYVSRIAAAKADLATRERIAEQHRIAKLLAEGLRALPVELERRWRDASLRRLWVDQVVALARALLPQRAWRIVHAPDWPSAERVALAAALEGAPTFEADARHRAGVAIVSSANVVDGTLEGLVADSDEIGAQLLFELSRVGEPEAVR